MKKPIRARKRRTSGTFARDLASARSSLPASSRVCPTCHRVYVADGRTDRRCNACESAAAAAEAVRL